MTETKHTPGPFVAKKFGYEKYGIYDERGTDIGFAHRERDATLFAAAPDLLAVCKDIEGFLKRSGYDTALVRAAIAKAEGRA